jgi:hypothetical protein
MFAGQIHNIKISEEGQILEPPKRQNPLGNFKTHGMIGQKGNPHSIDDPVFYPFGAVEIDNIFQVYSHLLEAVFNKFPGAGFFFGI